MMDNECCNTKAQAVLAPDVKKMITESPFVAIATVSKTGQPHLIVVGKVKEIRDDNCLVFGIYKMNITQENISQTGVMQVAVAAVSESKGYRLSGKACVKEKEVVLLVESVEPLL